MGRKKPFMPRAQTRTYQVVYRPLADTTAGVAEGDRVLRFVPAGNQRAARVAGDAATSVAFTDADADDEEAVAYVPPAPELAAAAASYHRKAWELGEYGFPDDGYDYSQHFRPLAGGGTGGVFLLAPGAAGGRGADAAPPVEEVLAGGRAEREAEELRQRDKDVDDILAALESDEEEEVGEQGEEAASDASDIDFDDDFVATANAVSAKERAWRAGAAEAAAEEAAERRASARAARAGGPDGVRPPRLVDAQLEKLLAKTYADSGSEDEDDDDSDGGGGGGVGGGDGGAGDSGGDGGSAGGATATTVTEGGGNALSDYADVIDTFLADYTAHGLHDKVTNRVPTEGGAVARARLGAARRPPTTTMTTSAAAAASAESATAAGDGGSAGPRPPPPPPSGDSPSDSEEEEELVPYTDAHHTFARWDCETVLSTYTTTENLPSVIGLPPRPSRPAPITLDRRFGAPAGHLPASASAVPPGLRPVLMAVDDADAVGDSDGDDAVGGGGGGGGGGPPAGTARPRDESGEAKRARKAAVRAARRGRRAEKAAVRAAFAVEGGRQARHATAVGPARVAVHFGA